MLQMEHDIWRMVDRYKDQAIQWRREFHRYAETGWREFRTTSRIVEILTENQIPVRYGREVINTDCTWSYPEDEIPEELKRAADQGADPDLLAAMQGYTGAAAIIDTGKEGPVIALRFDMDALNVKESEDEDHRPSSEGFASVNPGRMHACGHDGHTAIGLTLCLVLNEIKEQLKGTVKIIFQPGEEGAMGGQAVAESGILDDVDIFLSGHLGMGVPTGTFAVFSEGYLASTKFDLTFHGCSAHAGASPHVGKNAILAASSAVLAMYSFCQDGRGATRVNVGRFVGGSGRNVVADRVDLQMETRGEDDEIEQRLYHACLNAAESAAQMYGCSVQHEIKGYASSVVSDKELSELICRGISKVSEITEILPSVHTTASEDVGYMMKKVREHGGYAAYMGIGADIAAPHHNEKFDLDERAITIGVKAYLSILSEFI